MLYSPSELVQIITENEELKNQIEEQKKFNEELMSEIKILLSLTNKIETATDLSDLYDGLQFTSKCLKTLLDKQP
jgi:cell division protein FtsL